MATINVLDSVGATVALEKPLTPGQAAMAASRPVVLASDQSSIPVAATLAAETTKVIGTVRTASGGVAAGSLAAGSAVDGWDLTQGALADAAVAAGAAGSVSAKLRAISRDIVANVVLAAGANIIGLFKLSDGTNTAAVKAASIAPLATDPAVVVSISPNSVNANVQGGAPVTLGAVVPTATANGSTSSRVKAAASTNATSLKASAGQLYSVDVFNNAAYAVYLKLYNKASAPTVGTDTPIWTIPIAAGGGFSREFPRGKTFATGIAYAITKLEVDTDTTVVVADDLTGSIDWI